MFIQREHLFFAKSKHLKTKLSLELYPFDHVKLYTAHTSFILYFIYHGKERVIQYRAEFICKEFSAGLFLSQGIIRPSNHWSCL